MLAVGVPQLSAFLRAENPYALARSRKALSFEDVCRTEGTVVMGLRYYLSFGAGARGERARGKGLCRGEVRDQNDHALCDSMDLSCTRFG